jgi:hypothetical protein
MTLKFKSRKLDPLLSRRTIKEAYIPKPPEYAEFSKSRKVLHQGID